MPQEGPEVAESFRIVTPEGLVPIAEYAKNYVEKAAAAGDKKAIDILAKELRDKEMPDAGASHAAKKKPKQGKAG